MLTRKLKARPDYEAYESHWHDDGLGDDGYGGYDTQLLNPERVEGVGLAHIGYYLRAAFRNVIMRRAFNR